MNISPPSVLAFTRLLRGLVSLAVPALALAPLADLSGQASDLFISEYVEGSSNNKAIEIYNGTGAEVDLSAYELRNYANGATAPTNTVNLGTLQPTLADDAVIVLRNGAMTLYTEGYTSGVINFNGDDVVALVKDTVFIDLIGVVGVRENIFMDLTLRRLPSVVAPSAVYRPEEWETLPNNTVDGLGTHEFDGRGEPLPEPSAYPTALTAALSGVGGATLTWTDAAGTQPPTGYLLRISTDPVIAPPVDGTPVANDLNLSDGLGAFNIAQGVGTATVTGLAGSTTYHFALFPYTNAGPRIDFLTSGTAPTASVTTDTIALFQPFDSLGEWQIITLGAVLEWTIGGGDAEANAFGSSGPADDWLVSPAINFDLADNLVLTFDARTAFNDAGFNPALSVLVSTTHDGAATVDPTQWTPLAVALPAANSNTYANTGNTSLADFSGTGYLAFRYQSSGTAGNSSERWEIDNVLVFPSDEVAPSLSVSVTPETIADNAGAEVLSLTVSLPEARDLATVVTLAANDAGAVFTNLPGLTIPAGATSATVTLGPRAGASLEAPLSVRLTASASGLLSGSATVTVNPTANPFLTLSVTPTTFAENAGANAATGTVTLSEAPASYPFVISLSSSDSGEAAVPATVSLGSGLSATFAVGAVTDGVYDLDQTVTLTATATGYTTATTSVVVTNVDNVPPLTASIAPSSVFENAGVGAATLTVNLPQAPLQGYPVTLNLTSTDSDGSEVGFPASVQVTAADGLVKTIPIDVRTDGIADGNQTITFTAAINGYGPATATLEVLDVDQSVRTLQLLVEPTSIREGTTATGTVLLSETVSAPLVVTLTNPRPTEVSIPATVTIASGAATAGFVVTALDDGVVDGNQTFTLVASASEWGTGQRTITVLDANLPNALSVSINPGAVNEGQTALATISANNIPTSGLTVTLVSNDTTEMQPAVASLTLTRAAPSQVVTLQALTDNLLDGDQTALLQVSASGYPSASASLTVRDVNLPNALTLALGASSLDEGQTTTGTLTLTRTDSSVPVTLTLSSSDLTEATVSPAEITIPAGEASVSRTVTITAVTDGVNDGEQTVQIEATAPGFPAASIDLTVRDINLPNALSLTFGVNRLNEGQSTTGTITLTRTDPSAPVTLALSSSDTTEATVSPSEITIPAGEATVTRTVTVTAVADGIVDQDQTVEIAAAAEGFTTARQSLTVVNVDVERLLTLDLGADSAAEGTTLVAEVLVSVAPTTDLTVTLVSSAPERVIVPGSVTIPAGTMRTSYSVQVLDDGVFSAAQMVTVTATAGGFSGSSVALEVRNIQPRTVWLRPVPQGTTVVGVNEVVTLAVRVANPDSAVRAIRFFQNGEAIDSLSGTATSTTFRPGQTGTVMLSAQVELADGSIDTSAGEVELIVTDDPVRNDEAFLTFVMNRLLEADATDFRYALYRGVLRERGRAAMVAELLEEDPEASLLRRTFETAFLMLGRYPTYDELYVTPLGQWMVGGTQEVDLPSFLPLVEYGPTVFNSVPPLFHAGGVRGLAMALMEYRSEVTARFGGNPVEIPAREFFRVLWQRRHGVEPTAQQIVQAVSRIENFGLNRPTEFQPFEEKLYGRGRFVEALINEERFEFGNEVIFNPPTNRLRQDTLANLLAAVFWSSESELHVPSAEILDRVRPLSLVHKVGYFLQHPNFWAQAEAVERPYAWLGATDVDGSGWKRSDWFGWYFLNDSVWPWVFHATHGFIYVAGDDRHGSGFWFYDRALGWLWTRDPLESGPNVWMYRASTQSWYFYLEGTSTPRWFYGLVEGDWLAL